MLQKSSARGTVETVMNNKPSYAEIAQSLNLWRTYVDIDGIDTEEQFNMVDWSERVALMVEMYGPEEDAE